MIEPIQEWLSSLPIAEHYVKVIVLLIRITILIVVARLALHIGGLILGNLFDIERTRLKIEHRKAKTLEALLKSVLRYTIYFLLTVSIIDALGLLLGQLSQVQV